MVFFFETATRREELVSVALGNEKADITIERGTLVNVATSEMYQADIAVKGERIAIVGDVEHTKGISTQVLDAAGKYLVPGLIDTHFHIESTMVSPWEFSRAILPRGNTTVVVDPSWTANVAGIKGLKLLSKHAKSCPVRILLDAPSCVPLALYKLITPGYEFGVKEIEQMLSWNNVVALGEMNDFKRVLNRDRGIHAEIRAAMHSGKITNGNAPQMMGKELAAYIAAGIHSDHEVATAEEGVERLRSGIRLMIRQGSSEKNLPSVIGAITKKRLDHRHCCFCTDDKNVLDLLEEGLVDGSVRAAIEEGLDPMKAIQMATINAAEHIGTDRELGSLSPGKIADILLVDDLSRFSPGLVIASGEVVARDGKVTVSIESERYPRWTHETISVRRRITPDDLRYTTKTNGTARVWVMRFVEGQITSEAIKGDLQVKDGEILLDISQDIVKAVVVERYGRTSPNIGKGFVTGFGVKSGAIASSVSADTHHLTSIGTNDHDIAVSLNRLIELGGGIVIVENGVVLSELPLPIFGFTSIGSLEVVARNLRELNATAKKLGCRLSSPFMTLSFLGNPSIPVLKLSDRGLMLMSTKIIALETD
jgi:adenine deaminase